MCIVSLFTVKIHTCSFNTDICDNNHNC